MKFAVVSSTTLFDPTINPGMRFDAAFGISLAAIEQGRIDLLRECFDDLFSETSRLKWWTNFRKCKTWDEAEKHLLWAYGREQIDRAKLPVTFREGMRKLLQTLLTENLQKLETERTTLQGQIEQLQTMLNQKEQ